MVEPASLVISRSEVEDAFAIATRTAVIASVPTDVWKVKVSDEVAEEPGAMVIDDGSEPVVMVVPLKGVEGEPVGTVLVE